MFCSNCGSKVSEGARFCSICGAKLPEMPEQTFRTFGDLDFEEPKRVEEPVADASKVIDEIPETPKRESLSFDWSNVTDEPRKREIPDIKSPWAATGGIDEKELYAEMTPSTEKSRTMNFIDLLKAEKEEKERKAADQAIEYTQVLELDADLTAFDEVPKLHYAPLYEDVDAPVRTPFDDIERKPEPAVREEPRFEKPEPVFREEPRFEKQKPDVTTSRETIAMFDDYVKSFEAGAGIIREEPKYEEPMSGASKFELPDFLRKAAGFGKEAPAEPKQTAPVSEFDNIEIKETAAPEPEVNEAPAEAPVPEPVYTMPAAEPEPEPVVEEVPEVDLSAYEIRMDDDPVFEEPVFEEPKYDDGGFDEGGTSGMEDMYLDMDLDSAKFGSAVTEAEDGEDEEDEGIDEAALFAEMQETRPKKTGMTIAAPADRESEIEALKSRLAELMGTEEPEPEPIAEGAVTLEELNRAEFRFEPVINSEVDELFDGPIQGFPETLEEEEAPEVEVPVIRLETEAFTERVKPAEPVYTAPAPAPVVEPAPAPREYRPSHAAPVYEPAPVVEPTPAPEPVYTAPAVEPEPAATPAAAPTPAPEPVFTAPVVEPTPVPAPEPVLEPAPVIEPTPAAEPVAPAPVVEPTPVAPVAPVVETAAPEPVAAPVEEIYAEPAPVVIDEAAAIAEAVEAAAEPVAPAPVVEVVEEAAAVEEEEKSSDALSLEDIERDLFGDVPAADVEAEETKKIDKFYTLYRKNEEFQRLLDEEYDKLRGEEKSAAPVAEAMAEAVAPAVVKLEADPAPVVEEQPVEDSKAYRQIEDETIYQAFEIPKELLAKADGNAAAAGPVEVKTADRPLVEVEPSGTSYKKDDRKAAKAAAKAEKARKKEEKKLAKAGKSAAATTSASEVEYEDVDSGSGFLTVLAVIIAIILVILLAVILILQVAPDSSIAIAIDSLIENITGGFSLFDPGNGQYLL